MDLLRWRGRPKISNGMDGSPHLGLFMWAQWFSIAGMPEFASSTIVILLGSLLGLVALLTMVLLGISRSLARIERRLTESPAREPATPSVAETLAGGAFETFLKEDPSRRKLPKNEQFAAYRRWRQEQGLNWSNS